MTANEVLELIRAGYTRAEIDAMPTDPTTSPAEPAPAEPAPAEPAPAEPAPAEPAPAEPAQNEMETLLQQLLTSVKGLQTTVQSSQVLMGSQAKPDSISDRSFAATANIINPFNHETKK